MRVYLTTQKVTKSNTKKRKFPVLTSNDYYDVYITIYMYMMTYLRFMAANRKSIINRSEKFPICTNCPLECKLWLTHMLMQQVEFEKNAFRSLSSLVQTSHPKISCFPVFS